MALSTEPRAGEGPAAGVIEEAKRRQRRRRAAGTAFGALAALVAAALWVGGGAGGSSASGEPEAGARALKLSLAHGRVLIGGRPAPVSIEPSLQAGNVGVCISVAGQGGSCNGSPPTAADPVYGGGGFTAEEKVGPRGEIDALFTGPRVAAVRVAHLGTFTAHRVTGLPASVGEVVFYRPPGARGSVLPPGTSAAALRGFEHATGPALTETLLDSSGRTIRVREQPTFTLPNSYWHGAEAPPARGRCAMGSSFAGVKTEWGQVTQQIAADPGLTVPAWLTCLHVWYSAGTASFETAILLNASSPGSAPAPLWGAEPVPGDPGVVQIPEVERAIHFRFPRPSPAEAARELAQDTKRGGRAQAERLLHQVEQMAGKEQTYWDVLVPATVARRVGAAWLLVRYGNSLAQRIAFLDSLHVTRIELPRAR